MADYYFSVNLDNDRTLCLAPLTNRHIEHCGVSLEDESGYFLYEKCNSEEFGNIEIIARVMSEDAAFKLRDMFNMS